jgi:hypothetical protein
MSVKLYLRNESPGDSYLFPYLSPRTGNMEPSSNIHNSSTIEQQKYRQERQEIQQLFREIGGVPSQSRNDYSDMNDTLESKITDDGKQIWQPLLALGFGTAVLLNIGLLCSLPPVLRGRGMFSFHGTVVFIYEYVLHNR